MSKFLICFLVLLFSFSVFSGTVLMIKNDMGQQVWMIKPVCKAASSDTCGPVKLEYSKYFSINFNGRKLVYKDTAIVDSGFKVRIRMSNLGNKTDLYKPKTEDSLINIFGLDSIQKRTEAGSKGLTLPVAQYIYLIFTRFDSNADTLDFKRSSGLVDTAMTINTYREK